VMCSSMSWIKSSISYKKVNNDVKEFGEDLETYLKLNRYGIKLAKAPDVAKRIF
jgi:hypothetical protein